MKKISVNIENLDDYQTSEAFKTIRTNILFSTKDTKVLTVTSSDSGDGKSTSSLRIAHSLSEIGKRVLFVDADMRRSMFALKCTGEENLLGLSHYLSGQNDLEDVIYETDHEGLFTIFCGVYPPNPVELLISEQFETFVAEAKKAFDYVIIDTPPIGLVTDAAVCSKLSDGIIFVVSSGKTKLKKALEAKKLLESTGTKIIGCVLNNINTKVMGYYSQYKYKYEYKSDGKKIKNGK